MTQGRKGEAVERAVSEDKAAGYQAAHGQQDGPERQARPERAAARQERAASRPERAAAGERETALRRGKARAEAAERPDELRIGIRELRQHASVWVDLAEQGYTIDVTKRGRLVAQLVPVGEPASPVQSLIAAGIIEPPEKPGGVGDIEPYPVPPSGQATASEVLRQIREEES